MQQHQQEHGERPNGDSRSRRRGPRGPGQERSVHFANHTDGCAILHEITEREKTIRVACGPIHPPLHATLSQDPPRSLLCLSGLMPRLGGRPTGYAVLNFPCRRNTILSVYRYILCYNSISVVQSCAEADRPRCKRGCGTSASCSSTMLRNTIGQFASGLTSVSPSHFLLRGLTIIACRIERNITVTDSMVKYASE